MSYIGNTPGVSSQRVVLEEVISGSPKSAFTPISGYTLGYLDVLVNGVEVDSADYTASDGVTVTLATAAAVGDTVKIKTWLPRGLSDGYMKSEADARYLKVDGSNYVTGNLGVGTNSVLGNSTLNAVLGIAVRNQSTAMGYFQSYNANAGADLKTWRWGGDSSGNFVLQTVNDAYSAATGRFALASNGDAALGGNTKNGGANSRWLALHGTTPGNYSGGIAYALDDVVKGYHYYQSNYLVHQANSGVGHIFYVNTSTVGATLDTVGNLSVNGNFVVANGKGIDFSASSNLGGVTTEVFDDYEAGSWTA